MRKSCLQCRTPGLTVVAAILLLALVGCDEETLGPETRGTIEGLVQEAETDNPITGANVTTSPPTQSVLTDGSGRFQLPDVPTGNYTIEASKSGYTSRSVTVKVQERRTATATIPLERGEEFGSKTDSLAVEVTDWYNDRVNRDTTGADSLFANVEFEARNAGSTTITTYEIIFKIRTDENTFSEEVVGDSLKEGEFDVGRFRRFTRTSPATDVRATDTYVETE